MIQAALEADVSPGRAAARRLAYATRGVIHRLIGSEAPEDVLNRIAVRVEAAADELGEYRQRELHEEFAEAAMSADPHAFFERSPLIGHGNPLAPPIELHIENGMVIGRATFGAAYEGPPGCVHGGYIAASFDDVLGLAQSMSGNGGMTGTLSIRYERPTPLLQPVTFEGELVGQERRKIFTKGVLKNPAGEVTARAEAVFISLDLETFLAKRDAR
jgi:acyl-coenzyme A thioesterase PaaI-like protein